MKIKNMITIASVCLAGMLHAQENRDYVVTMERDTVFGKITSVKDGKLKMKMVDGKRTFKPGEVYRAFNGEKTYAPSYMENGLERVPDVKPKLYRISTKKTKRPPTFAEVITDGEIVLYHFKKTRSAPIMSVAYAGAVPTAGMSFPSNQKNYFALKKSTGEAIEIRKSGFYILGNMSKKKIAINLAKLIEDEPEWMKKFEEEDKLDLARFIEYIEGYNKLRQEKGNDPKRYDYQIF